MIGTLLTQAFEEKLNLHEIAIITVNFAKTIDKGVYGKETGIAANIIHKHIPKISNKTKTAISDKNFGRGNICSNLQNILQFFILMRRQPSTDTMAILKDSITSNLEHCSNSDIAHIFSQMGNLSLQMGNSFIQQTTDKFLKDLGNLKPNQAVNFLHSLAIIDAVNEFNGISKPHIRNVFEQLVNNQEFNNLLIQAKNTTKNQRQLLHAAYWFKGIDLFEYPKETNNKSKLEIHIADKLTEYKNNIKLLSTKPHNITKSTIDLKFEFNNHIYYLECDGGYHFIKTPDGNDVTFDGSTILQTALKVKRDNDLTILRLPAVIHNRIDNVWDMFLEQNGHPESGSYTFNKEGILIPFHNEPEAITYSKHQAINAVDLLVPA